MPRHRRTSSFEPEQLTRWVGGLVVLLAIAAVFGGLQYRRAVLRDRTRSLQVAEARAQELVSEFKTRVETWVWLGLLEAFVPAFTGTADNMQGTVREMRRRADAWLATCSQEYGDSVSAMGQPVKGTCLSVRPETYFVMEVAGPHVAVSDLLAEGPVPDEVIASLRNKASSVPDDLRRFHVVPVTIDTSTFLAHMRVMRDARGRRLATVGLLRTADLPTTLFAPLWSRTLASTFPGTVNPERLATVSLRLIDGRSLHRPSANYSGIATETILWGVQESPVRASVTLNPETLSEVVPGGIPSSPDAALAIGALVLGLVVSSTLFALQQARRLMHTRTLFLTGISHELRTPLTQILMYAETLERRELDDDRRAKAQRVIVRESRRLIHMIENVLAFARSATGRIPLNPRHLTLARTIEETLADLAPLLARRGCQVNAQLDDTLVVHADPGAIRQVLVNLIDNAVRYGPPDQVIRMCLTREDATAVLSIADEGPGIAAAERDRVWQPFVRIGTGGEGTGIGLPLVRRLCDAMGGSATFAPPDQRPGGLVVEVRLPIASGTVEVRHAPELPVTT